MSVVKHIIKYLFVHFDAVFVLTTLSCYVSDLKRFIRWMFCKFEYLGPELFLRISPLPLFSGSNLMPGII